MGWVTQASTEAGDDSGRYTLGAERSCTSSSDMRDRIAPAARRVCLAPMLDRTDRHFRYLVRQITRTALLYTELVPASAIVCGRQTWMLEYNPIEHPVAIQFGGNTPEILAKCARIAADCGYDEVNLNVGCPSNRVTNGRFGACLMANPGLVARCVEAMAKAVAIPVTVKHRIGIDAHYQYEDLKEFVTTVAQAGCTTFIVHARKAWLNGLSPRQNRFLPPLDHAMVYRLKADNPELTIITNGGIVSLAEGVTHMEWVDGVMIGRAAYEAPYLLAEVDRLFGSHTDTPPSRYQIISGMCEYLIRESAAGTPSARILRHMHGLLHGQPGARRWRHCLTAMAAADYSLSAFYQIPQELQELVEH
ncbi:tRNA dihydrouridine synthase A [invertebrate metagenome]|uniref:tRNA dihydrouridine synthase A n=1 Tax=invertebrate metagenome TaxID=1711999 RepID=A0A484H6Z7_9ZZZZ